jgi:hypothetical protein
MTMDDSNEHDPKLEALFAREHTHLSAEPFLTSTLAAVAAERRRGVVTRRVLQVAGILAVLIATPWLIEASVWISRGVDVVLVRVSTWLANPVGIVIVAMAAALVLSLARRWRVRLARLF